ncbi:CRISPR-associated protein CasA/Cse1 [Pseudoclavibacter triregionum]|nr:CRISPR-associated protein CasA/Cse1 [Pseudoclavibacter triregionum]
MTDALVSFQLVDEPWIRTMTLDGREEVVGLLELFERAHELRALSGELPTQDFAILRLLLAILYRALDPVPSPDPVERWIDLDRAPSLPPEPIRGYLDRWRDRFDLFDAAAPFFQVADLRTAKGEWKAPALLVPDVDTDGALFTMASELHSLSFSEAARWLVHCQAYDFSGIKSGALGDPRVKGGKGYPLGVGWCGWLGGTWIEGRTLKDTLLLNLVLDRQPRMRSDVPIWEEPPLDARERTEAERGPFGQLGLLTWPQRRIRLHAEDDAVTGVLIANGDPVPYTTQLQHELMTEWRYSKAQSDKAKAVRYMPRTLEADHAAWRGLATMLPGGTPEQVRSKDGLVAKAVPAGVLEWSARLAREGALSGGTILQVAVVSMSYGAQMSSFTDLALDRLRFAAALETASGAGLRAVAQEGVVRAEAATRAVAALAEDLAVAAGGNVEDAGKAPAAALHARFDESFPAWLATLVPGVDGDSALVDWTEAVRAEARRAAARLVAGIAPAAWAGRRVSGFAGERIVSAGSASRRFEFSLAKALPTPGQAAGDLPREEQENHD